MRLIDREIIVPERNGEVEIYPIGDTHVGATNCAETLLRKTKKSIAEKRNAYWIGGGDYLDSIKPTDLKRFDMSVLPDWMLEGDAELVRTRLNDILQQQVDRFCGIFQPVRSKCLGLIEGNHEYSIRKYHNHDVLTQLCNRMKSENLTDQALIRLRFRHGVKVRVLFMYIRHGHGGGRSAGSEPNHLQKMLDEWEIADIALRGHSHTFGILPPKPVMHVPTSGELPDELQCRYRYAANWGTYKLSHIIGDSTYESRANYPARPMLTCKVVIKPFQRHYHRGREYCAPQIEIRSITL